MGLWVFLGVVFTVVVNGKILVKTGVISETMRAGLWGMVCF